MKINNVVKDVLLGIRIMERSDLLKHLVDFDVAMKMINWKKKRILKIKPPKDFEGW